MTNLEKLTKVLTGVLLMGSLAFVLLSVSPNPSFAGVTDDEFAEDDCGGSEVAKIYMQGFAESQNYAVVNKTNASTEAMSQSWKADAETKPQPHGDINDTYCLHDVIIYFDVIAGLVSAASMVEAAVIAAIEYFASAVCDAAVDAIMNTVNNALDLICIPMPDISYSISLPSVERKTCNGLSLREAVKVETVPGLELSSRIPQDFLSAPLSRWIQRNGWKDGGYSLRNGAF